MEEEEEEEDGRGKTGQNKNKEKKENTNTVTRRPAPSNPVSQTTPPETGTRGTGERYSQPDSRRRPKAQSERARSGGS